MGHERLDQLALEHLDGVRQRQRWWRFTAA